MGDDTDTPHVDLARIAREYAMRTDEALLRIANADEGHYLPEVAQLAQAELRSRGIDPFSEASTSRLQREDEEAALIRGRPLPVLIGLLCAGFGVLPTLIFSLHYLQEGARRAAKACWLWWAGAWAVKLLVILMILLFEH